LGSGPALVLPMRPIGQ